jgi:hypothetical protein
MDKDKIRKAVAWVKEAGECMPAQREGIENLDKLASYLDLEIRRPTPEGSAPTPIKVFVLDEYVLLGIHKDVLNALEGEFLMTSVMAEYLCKTWGYDAIFLSVSERNRRLSVYTTFKDDSVPDKHEHVVDGRNYRFQHMHVLDAVNNPELYIGKVLEEVARALENVLANVFISPISMTYIS